MRDTHTHFYTSMSISKTAIIQIFNFANKNIGRDKMFNIILKISHIDFKVLLTGRRGLHEV